MFQGLKKNKVLFTVRLQADIFLLAFYLGHSSALKKSAKARPYTQFSSLMTD
jgi:hypothetical protein